MWQAALDDERFTSAELREQLEDLKLSSDADKSKQEMEMAAKVEAEREKRVAHLQQIGVRRLCQQGLHREPQQHVDVMHVLPGLTPSHVLNKEANE